MDFTQWLGSAEVQLLAGPQLRRVTPSSVTVWVALSRAGQVSLELYAGPAIDHGAERRVRAGLPIATSERVGTIDVRGLHVAAVTVDTPLTAGAEYAYNVIVDDTVDLKGWGLLATRPASGLVPAQPPIGYADGKLPGFVAAPALDRMILIHASCRKAVGFGGDALPSVDARIANPEQRPHLLVLTGDQIYADDVPLPLLPSLTALGEALVGSETLPCRFPDGERWVRPDQVELPAGQRHRLMAGAFSSTAMSCHLLSFGEFAAMYLFAWSPVPWQCATIPADLAGFEAAFGPRRDLSILKAFDGNEPAVIDPARYQAELSAVTGYAQGIPAVQRALANVPTSMIFDDHEVTDDWNRTAGWQRDVLGTGPRAPAGRAIVRNALLAYACFQDLGNDPDGYHAGQCPKLVPVAQIEALTHGAAHDDWRAAAAAVDASYGIGRGLRPSFAWHYTIAHHDFDLVMLDTRTRRKFRGDAPPDLLDPAGMDEQLAIADRNPDRLLIVVSPGNVVSDGAMGFAQRTAGVGRQLGDRLDREAWDEQPAALGRLLAKLAGRRRVVILSGDVHHGFTSSIEYFEPTRRRVVAQLVSSAARNYDPGYTPMQSDGARLTRLYLRWYERYGGWWTADWPAESGAYAAFEPGVRYQREQAALWVADARATLDGRLPIPRGYWRARNLSDDRFATASPPPPSRIARHGINRCFYWPNHIGVVTFGSDDVTHVLVPAPAALQGEVLESATCTVRFTPSAAPDPLGLGWPP